MSELPGQLPLFGNPEPTPELNIEPEKTLEELRESNRASYEQLAKYGAIPNPGTVLAARLELLIDTLVLGPQRTRFEIDFEKQMRDMLRDCHDQVVRAQLLGGNQPPSQTLLLPR